jgi:hypothetical protein
VAGGGARKALGHPGAAERDWQLGQELVGAFGVQGEFFWGCFGWWSERGGGKLNLRSRFLSALIRSGVGSKELAWELSNRRSGGTRSPKKEATPCPSRRRVLQEKLEGEADERRRAPKEGHGGRALCRLLDDNMTSRFSRAKEEKYH